MLVPVETKCMPSTSQNTVSIDRLAFFGAYEPAVGTAARKRTLYSGLVHWMESEKFRGASDEHHAGVLHCPSAKEAHKYARRHQKEWRSDWLQIRSTRLLEGMYYAMANDPDSGRWREDGASIATMLEPLTLPTRFVAQISNAFCALRDGRRYVIFSNPATPPDVLGKRLAMIQRTYAGQWCLVVWVGRRPQWQFQDWATRAMVPCVPIGSIDAKSDDKRVQQACRIATHAVVFERKGGRSMDGIIATLRERGLNIELDLYKEDVERPAATQPGGLFN
jgi:hypothetical protein